MHFLSNKPLAITKFPESLFLYLANLYLIPLLTISTSFRILPLWQKRSKSYHPGQFVPNLEFRRL
jgi:hypothetical protein